MLWLKHGVDVTIINQNWIKIVTRSLRRHKVSSKCVEFHFRVHYPCKNHVLACCAHSWKQSGADVTLSPFRSTASVSVMLSFMLPWIWAPICSQVSFAENTIDCTAHSQTLNINTAAVKTQTR